MQVLNVTIKGMDCAECTEHVAHALRPLTGVCDVQVFLGAEKAKIMFQDSPPSNQAIMEAVASAGYRAVFPDTATGKSDEEPIQPYKEIGSRLLTALGVLFGLVLFVVVAGEFLGLFEKITNAIPWAVWLVLVLAISAPILNKVIRAALKGQVISHTLMTVGVLAAIAVGEWASAAVVALFMRVGDFVERFTTEQARRTIKTLIQFAPQTARVVRDGQEFLIPVDQVHQDDIIIVRPGESIPVDGIVTSGSASVDQSPISGESMPVAALPGAPVFAASIVQTGMLQIQSKAIGMDTTYGKIIRLVEEAEANRGAVQRTADRFAGYYLPVVAFIALLTLIFRRDPLATAAVLVVACSCSFALATPIALLASIGSAARSGILIKGGKFLEALATVDMVFVDKTGTLTMGKPAITDIIPFGGMSESGLIDLAASVEKYSEHPLAEAVRQVALTKGIIPAEPQEFINIPGRGARANVYGDVITVLNQALGVHPEAASVAQQLMEDGKTLIYVHQDEELVGILAAADQPRPEVNEAMAAIRQMGIRHIELLTGDNEATAKSLADSLGINYRAGLLPVDKIAIIRQAQADGHKVVMVGDGINDAPALAQADVGIAMGKTGTAVAIEAAHITLLRDDWRLVPQALETARRTMRVVHGNILFTAGYNLIGLSLAAFGILPPVLAAAAQSLPDLGILANSARLIRK